MLADAAGPVSLVCIDDDPLMLEFIERRLRDRPGQLKCFSEPSEAIDFLSRHEVRTILVDQRMPAMDGIEFLRILASRDCNSAARKVLCSAVAPHAGTRDDAAALGAETLEKDRIRDRETLLQMLNQPPGALDGGASERGCHSSVTSV